MLDRRLTHSALGISLVAAALLAPAAPASGAVTAPCRTRFFKDLDPGLQGESNGITSPRFMRRMWIHDGFLLVLIQQGGFEGRYLSLYRVNGQGPNEWQHVADVAGSTPADQYLSADGLMLPSGELIVVVSSRQELFVADVKVVRFTYAGGGEWAADPLSPATVVPSSPTLFRFNATLAMDSMGRLFVSYIEVDQGQFAVRYSTSDDGLGWAEAVTAFSTWDDLPHKSARLSPVKVGAQGAMALVYYDHDADGEYLKWSYRLDSEADPEAGWTPGPGAGLIREMPGAHPSMYRHWSLARDGQGGLHLSWEELDGIHYSRFDGDPGVGWSAPLFLVDGVYSNVTTSLRAGESYVYVVADNRRNAVVGAAYDPVAGGWTPFYEIGAAGLGEHRRPSTPEQFAGGLGSRLPVMFQHENAPPAPTTSLLFSVILDCR